MINYVNGDLFQHIARHRHKNPQTKIVVPHVVNNVGAWGAGFVLAINKCFPFAKQKYLNEIRNCFLGNIIWDDYDRISIVNMIAQDNIFSKTNKKPIKYVALTRCMSHVAEDICRGKFGNPANIEIHAPKFGSGLAGGNWDFIEELIEEIWYDLSVTVYYL